MLRYSAYLALVFIAHCLIGLALYRWRFVGHPSIADSDFLTFTLPFALAALAYWLAIFVSPFLRPRSPYRQIGLIMLSFCTAVVSLFVYMLFGLNIYGS